MMWENNPDDVIGFILAHFDRQPILKIRLLVSKTLLLTWQGRSGFHSTSFNYPNSKKTLLLTSAQTLWECNTKPLESLKYIWQF